jgi:hypothetical protein
MKSLQPAPLLNLVFAGLVLPTGTALGCWLAARRRYSLIRLPEERCAALAGLLPGATLEFLRDQGVPELLEFRLIEHVFTLDMQPLLDGAVFRLGTVDRGLYAMGLRLATGHFGYAFVGEKPPWAFCNSSVECFLACFAATERLWELDREHQWTSEACGEWLEHEIRKIDPVVFSDENNIWSFLVEELLNGVV